VQPVVKEKEMTITILHFDDWTNEMRTHLIRSSFIGRIIKVKVRERKISPTSARALRQLHITFMLVTRLHSIRVSHTGKFSPSL